MLFDKNHAVIMGIINVTPDSFSDGGQFHDAADAIAYGRRLIEEGASILDIGGESTRPGAEIISSAQEIERIIPVIEGLRDCGALLSVDTRNAATMQATLDAGAGMINDVSALTHDAGSLSIAAAAEVPVVLMHMQGTPQTMQDHPVYEDVVQEVFDFLKARIEICEKTGVKKNRIIVDPGFGFGKTFDHNLMLLKNIGRFQALGVPVMVGLSRKSFIGSLSGATKADNRLGGSIAAALYARAQGVQIFRVHDVAETVQALKFHDAMRFQEKG